MKVLVAEDNYVNQKLIRKILEHLNYDSVYVSTGEEVLEELRKNKYDLILMDIFMPALDGYQTTQKIIEEHDENRPVIIALTASAMESDKGKCFDAGMDDYLSKPVMIDELKKVLSKWELKISS